MPEVILHYKLVTQQAIEKSKNPAISNAYNSSMQLINCFNMCLLIPMKFLDFRTLVSGENLLHMSKDLGICAFNNFKFLGACILFS